MISLVFRHFELCLDVATILQTKLRPRLRLIGDFVPAVDVAIVCCKEGIDVIRDTIIAALHTDYPEEKLRLIVSDDGADADLEAMVKAMQKRFPSKKLYYVARKKTPETSHKAGNLNFVFDFVKTLPGGPADFFSGLDADMIVEKRWLRASLAHLVNDPQMGYVCLCVFPLNSNNSSLPSLLTVVSGRHYFTTSQTMIYSVNLCCTFKHSNSGSRIWLGSHGAQALDGH